MWDRVDTSAADNFGNIVIKKNVLLVTTYNKDFNSIK